MVCYNHETRSGVNTCSECGNWLCEDCSIDVDGRIVCKKCVAELLDANRSGEPRKHIAVEKHVHHYEHRGYAPKAEKRKISRFLLLCFSFTVPGINYMFMGLMKRGIYAMAAFLLLFYCACELNAPLFAIAAGMVYVVSIFDGFNVRRKLIGEEHVEDGFSGITKALYRHKLPLGIVALLMIFSGVISNVMRSFTFSHYYRPYASNYSTISHSGISSATFVFIILIVAAVFYFFIRPLRKTKKGPADSGPDYDVIDKTNNR